MKWSFIFLGTWFAITHFVGELLYYLINMIPNGSICAILECIVFGIKVLSYVISSFLFLLYLWCDKESKKLKKSYQRKVSRMKNSYNCKVNKIKDHIKNSWYYIEDTEDETNE